MDWLTLAPTVLGGVLALVGGLSAQWWAERRSLRRQEREWYREDEYRTFEDRRAVYVEYYQRLKYTARLIYNAGLDGSEPEADWQLPLFENLQRLEVFAYRSVDSAAQEAYNALYSWGYRVTEVGRGDVQVERDPEYGIPFDSVAAAMQETYDETERTLLAAIRVELKIVPSPA